MSLTRRENTNTENHYWLNEYMESCLLPRLWTLPAIFCHQSITGVVVILVGVAITN